MDIADIFVVSGAGGPGCVSFRREKHVPRGGPDGGNGGSGGSVYVVAARERGTLLDFRFRRHYQAERGQPGQGRLRSGADGGDLRIPVPCGTSVYELPGERLLGDLVEPGQELCVAPGGKGGRGNHAFRSATNQAPRRVQPGEPGQSRHLRLELKLIADIGLVGAPNAGKSTLLGVLSSARPKVASYPFTTLVPNLGLVDLGDFTSCVVADIPGLVEGASEGRGLGTEFLRHLERTRALVLLVDLSAGAPVPALRMLRQELTRYGRNLPDLPYGVALTKRDLVDAGPLERGLAESTDWVAGQGAQGLVAISALTRDGIPQLLQLVRQLLRRTLPADGPATV